MVLADNEQDANLLLGLATHYHQQCFIGEATTARIGAATSSTTGTG